MKVWLEAWEWECCGDPFAVGATVNWNLTPVDDAGKASFTELFAAEIGPAITHMEGHHGATPLPPPQRVRVEAIHAVYWDRAPLPGEDSRTVYPVPGSARLQPREVGDPWSEPDADRERFEGYLVDVTKL
jgi:hypothetical protein